MSWRPHSSKPSSQPPPDDFHDHRRDRPLTDEGGRWLPNDEITGEPETLTELGREVITVQQPAAGGPPPSTAPAGTLHDPSDPRPWEAWCARQRHEEEVNGWPVTDEEGRWLPNKEWPQTPTSGNWGRPSEESRIFYNGQAVIPEVWDRGGYYTLSERQRGSIGGSQSVKDVQIVLL